MHTQAYKFVLFNSLPQLRGIAHWQTQKKKMFLIDAGETTKVKRKMPINGMPLECRRKKQTTNIDDSCYLCTSLAEGMSECVFSTLHFPRAHSSIHKSIEYSSIGTHPSTNGCTLYYYMLAKWKQAMPAILLYLSNVEIFAMCAQVSKKCFSHQKHRYGWLTAATMSVMAMKCVYVCIYRR